MQNDRYMELVERILAAQEEFLKAKIEANTVILDGRKYGKLFDCGTPTIFGMTVLFDNLPADYDFLLQYREETKMTNGDRIRSMSDEELANRLSKGACNPHCPCDRFICTDTKGGCRAAWLVWLKQEAE